MVHEKQNNIRRMHVLWKCNQAIIVGFGDNDHAIRGLMRFIEMTSRESRIEDVIRNGGAPNYKWWWLKTQRRFKFFYISNLSLGMSYYKGGHNKVAKVCNQVLNLIHIHSQLLSQDSLTFTVFILAVLPGAAVPHLKRDTAAVRHCHSWATALPRLNWPLRVAGYLYLPHSSPTALLPPLAIQTDANSSLLILSLLHWWPWALKHSFMISPSILERKGSKTRLETDPLIPKV